MCFQAYLLDVIYTLKKKRVKHSGVITILGYLTKIITNLRNKLKGNYVNYYKKCAKFLRLFHGSYVYLSGGFGIIASMMSASVLNTGLLFLSLHLMFMSKNQARWSQTFMVY